MSPPVLYLGDTSLSGAAGYLAGLLTHFEFGFDYVPSDRALEAHLAAAPRKLIILSDYPSAMLRPAMQKALLAQVSGGAGLMMIGGWESYHGLGGDWERTAVAEALPVKISAQDDRVNSDQPAMLVQASEHPIAAKLPWSVRPPTVGGYNRIKPKRGSQTVLQVQRFAAACKSGKFTITPKSREPMLVVGRYGDGRAAALATDLSPHWVGGLVDWGTKRVTAQADGSWAIEVGNLYAAFVRNLVAWTGQLE